MLHFFPCWYMQQQQNEKQKLLYNPQEASCKSDMKNGATKLHFSWEVRKAFLSVVLDYSSKNKIIILFKPVFFFVSSSLHMKFWLLLLQNISMLNVQKDVYSRFLLFHVQHIRERGFQHSIFHEGVNSVTLERLNRNTLFSVTHTHSPLPRACIPNATKPDFCSYL